MTSTDTVTFHRPMSPAPLGVILTVLGTQRPPPPFKLERGRCEIGSSETCDLIIADPTVSRRHVELTLVPEGVAVCDLGSRNGTFLLGHRIEKVVVAPGTQLQIGAVTLLVEPDNEALVGVPLFEGDSYRGMVGQSAAMRRVFATLAQLEGSLVPVLLQGESGVGKEVLAHALHDGSKVSSGPFVALNCGALPHQLVASELFGHRRGAFTGAVEDRLGAFESAHEGTLFLDEVSELPLDVQPMLLRALELGEVRRLGDDAARHVRVRVVAAANRELEEEVAAKRFREDLYYRLAVVTIRVPPLRTRPEDIEALANRFVLDLAGPPLPAALLAELRIRRWPGNARQLRNAVNHFVALGRLPPERTISDALDSALAAAVDVREPYAAQKDALIERFTRSYLHQLLEAAEGNKAAAARMSQLDRSYFGQLLTKHGVRSK